MPKTDKRVDAYIAKAKPFAQPILEYLRDIIHEGCPEAIETIKWGMPAFEHKGPLAGFAGFKEHCAFHFWKSSLVLDKEDKKPRTAMGSFGRITSIKDLRPRKKMVEYVRRATALNEQGIKVERAKPKRGQTIEAPAFMMSAIRTNKKALATWNQFPYSKKKDYIEWVTEAKTDETRDNRLITTVEWLSEGKSRNWKYETTKKAKVQSAT
jgi:uncharacterized protein YdeI (YjbR/CyaY-like superfamily)